MIDLYGRQCYYNTCKNKYPHNERRKIIVKNKNRNFYLLCH